MEINIKSASPINIRRLKVVCIILFFFFFFTFRLVAWFPLAEFKVKALPRNLRKTNKQED